MGGSDLKLWAVHRQLFDLLCDHAPLSLLINLLVPILVSIPLVHEVPVSVLLVWCTSAAVVGLIRFILLWNLQGRDVSNNGHMERWGQIYFSFTVAQGLIWGVGSVFLLSHTTGFNQVLILILIAGMSAGAIPLLGAMLPTYTGFLLSATVPVLAWLIIHGEIQYAVLGGIGGLYVGVCFIGAKRFNSILTRSLLPNEYDAGIPGDMIPPLEDSEDRINLRQQVEREARERAKMEQVITTLSAGFVRLTVDEIDEGINQALTKIGRFAGVDRSYIFLLDSEDDCGRITHQWCKFGVSPRVSPAFHELRLSMMNIRRGRGNYVTSPAMLPIEADAEREFFARDHLKSWFAVPLITDGKARGFLGFDALENEITWSEDAVALLRIAGAAVMNALERKREEVLIQNQAFQDPLTSLPNRRLFMEHLEKTFLECRRRGTKAAILFVDVDYFKNVNDSLGHGAGDSLLKQMARRLQNGLRGEDIACRLGGDEFVVLLAHVGEDSINPEKTAISLAQRVHKDLSLPYEISGQELNITVSMGVELFPAENATAESVISNADAAMYRAKDSGRNFIQFFQQEIHQNTTSRIQLHKDLRSALRQNEFEFYAQSQFNSHGDVVADELLLHWNKGGQGMMEPRKFMSLAEEMGLISEIDEWVINNACQLIKQQKSLDHRKKITYAINVSPKQFQKREFAELVSDALNNSGLNGGFLEFEVTGDVINGNQGGVVKKMNALRDLGVRIALDDFGVGHSSLACLKYLPIDKIKIDQSFVRGIDESPTDAAIVDAIISIAQLFDLEVVAEGVDNNVQFEFLQALGVELFQGHYFGRPRPVNLN